MTSRDFFRASLELARVRLIIGGVIVALFTGFLAWFFWLIDERFILLELSPIFIGGPLLGLGGQLLRLHAAYRKYFKKLPKSLHRVQYHFEEGADGYDVHYGDNFSHLVWRDLTKVIEKRNYFVFDSWSGEARAKERISSAGGHCSLSHYSDPAIGYESQASASVISQ